MKRSLDWYNREPRAIINAKPAARMTCRQAAGFDLVPDLIYEGGDEGLPYATVTTPCIQDQRVVNGATVRARLSQSDDRRRPPEAARCIQ